MKRGEIKYAYVGVDLEKILRKERENLENWEHLSQMIVAVAAVLWMF